MKFCYKTNFTLPNNPKDLDPSYKMDLDLWNCFGKKNSVFQPKKYCSWDSAGEDSTGSALLLWG